MTMSRRHFIAALAAAPAVSLLPRAAFAAFPERPIRLIVPFAAGGNADIVGRIIAEHAGRALPGTIVVENKGGAGGGVGADYVAKAAPDGYTLLNASNGPMTCNPFVQKISYDPMNDFAPVALTSYVPHCLIVTNKFPAKTLGELIALAQKEPVNIATSGAGSATHMTLERFKHASKADKLTHVPYRGGGALMPDVIAGTVAGAMTEFSTALELHKGGQGRILAIAALKRSQLAPDIATFDESGVKGFKAQSFIGVVAPAKTPAEIIAQLQQAIAKALLADGPAAKRLIELGSDIATAEEQTSAGFGKFLHTDFEQMREAAKLAGLTPT